MRALLLTTNNNQHIKLLMELAQQLNVKVKEVIGNSEDKTETMKMAESSFIEDWNKPEDDVWDTFLKSAPDVSAR